MARLSTLQRLSVFTAQLCLFGLSLAVAVVPRDGQLPSLTFDPNSTKYCTWWVDLDKAKTCDTILVENNLTLDTFRRWNPSVPANCGTLTAGRSYCVEAMNEPPPPPTTITSKTPSTPKTTSTSSTKPPTTTSRPATTTTKKPATTTTTGNGVKTPTPTQTGMVTNCNKFHFVKEGDTCATLASKYSISVANFIKWNPAAKSDCSGLWKDTNACVGIIGGTTPTSTKKTSTTTTKGGVSTPTPTQPGMVNNCKKFVIVKKGDTCEKVASANKITLDNFIKWNTGVGGKACTTLWEKYYVCVGV